MTNLETRNKIISELTKGKNTHSIRIFVDDLIAKFESETLFITISDVARNSSIDISAWVICIRTLCRIDENRANQFFTEVLQTETDEEKRGWIIHQLTRCGTGISVPMLIEILKNDRDPDIRFLCVVALRRIGDIRAIPILKKLIEEDKGVNYEGETIASQAKFALKQLSANNH